MQTCTFFVTATNWMSRELSRADSDLNGPERPPGLTNKQWKEIQSIRAQAASSSGHNSSMASDTSDEEARIKNMFDLLSRWELNFSRHLQILLDALNHYAATETVVLLSLCARLSTANQGTQWAGLRSEEEL